MSAHGYQRVLTSKLEVGYREWNPQGQRVAILLHGWPDSPETWNAVAPAIAAQGFRVLAPALRGYGPTRFLDAATFRSGELAALGRDLLEFIDALAIDKPALVGHDWGARAAANACGLRAGVASHLVMISVGYGTNDPSTWTLSYDQTHRYWYHWFMATPRGEYAVENDRRAFTRYMWEAWGPGSWVTDAAFDEAARAFDNPDWAAITLHSYRSRWGLAECDPSYATAARALTPAPILSVPTLVLHGREDYVNHPDTSAGREKFFTDQYRRVILDGVGHFPQRERPEIVASQLLEFLASSPS